MEEQSKTQEQILTEKMWKAARTGDLKQVRHLVENTAADLQARDKRHNSALHYGVLSGNAELVQYLVERVGLSPLSANEKGETPWDLAYREGKEEVLAWIKDWADCSYEETYHNPIRRGFYPDPSVVRVGEDYYMVNSTFMFFPCIPVSHSGDLIHWEIIGYGITNPDWARLDQLNGGMGYWAPDISYSDGRFYITATLRCNDDMEKRRVQMVTSADRPEGPYDEPVFLDDDGIDPSIFHDDDGRKYMILNKGARIRELSRDCRHFLSPGVLLWYGDCRRKPEGPHLLKYNGYYYLFLAEGGTGRGHQITVARSRTLLGPYEPSPLNPILHQWDDGALIQCCGHGKPLQLTDGRWYVVYLCLRMLKGQRTVPSFEDSDVQKKCRDDRYGILGRETALDPLTWTKDGWPLINGGRGPSDQQKLPFQKAAYEMRKGGAEDGKVVDSAAAASQRSRAEGAAAAGESTRQGVLGGYPRWKGRDWMTPRPLSAERLLLEQTQGEEHLRLKGQEGDLNTKEFRSIFVSRQESFDFEARCELAAPDLKEGQSLGMTCYYDENSYIKCGVSRREGKLGFLLQEYVGEGYTHEKFVPCQEKLPAGRRVRVKVKVESLIRTFSCMLPTKVESMEQQKYANEQRAEEWEVICCERLEDTSYLSSEGLKKGKRFTGATLGVYVQGDVWGEFLDWNQ